MAHIWVICLSVNNGSYRESIYGSIMGHGSCTVHIIFYESLCVIHGSTNYDGPGFDGPGYDGPGFDGPGYDGTPCSTGVRRVKIKHVSYQHNMHITFNSYG